MSSYNYEKTTKEKYFALIDLPESSGDIGVARGTKWPWCYSTEIKHLAAAKFLAGYATEWRYAIMCELAVFQKFPFQER